MSQAIPVEIKELQGTTNGTRERRKAEPRYQSDRNFEITAPPETLTPEAQSLWLSLIAQLASVGLNFPSIYEYLESYCHAWEHKNEAREDLEINGKYLYSIKGERKINPAWTIYQDSLNNMIIIGAKLGLTPVDKTKISTLAIDNTKDKNKAKNISVSG